VRVGEVDPNDRVHFSVIEDRDDGGPGEMSYLAFVNRFARIESAEDACVRIKHLGYVAFGVYESTVRNLELLSGPCPERDRIAFAQRQKETQAFAYCGSL